VKFVTATTRHFVHCLRCRNLSTLPVSFTTQGGPVPACTIRGLYELDGGWGGEFEGSVDTGGDSATQKITRKKTDVNIGIAQANTVCPKRGQRKGFWFETKK
jgi:hypothetical protein